MPDYILDNHNSAFQNIYQKMDNQAQKRFFSSWLWIQQESNRLGLPKEDTILYMEMLNLFSLSNENETLVTQIGRDNIRRHWKKVIPKSSEYITNFSEYFISSSPYVDTAKAVFSIQALTAIPLGISSQTDQASVIDAQAKIYRNLKNSSYNEKKWYDSIRHLNSSFIPLFYTRNMNMGNKASGDYSRLLAFPGTNLLSIQGPFKSEVLRFIQDSWGCSCIKIDLQAAHTFIARGFILRSGELTPELDSFLLDPKGVWEKIDSFIKESYPIAHSRFSPLDGSQKGMLKKISKTTLYKVLNGGSIARHDNLEEVFKDDSLYNDDIEFGLGEALRAVPIFVELIKFNKLCLNNRNQVYLPTIVESTPSSYKATSRVLASLESMILANLSFKLLEKGYLIISLEHDGLVCLDLDENRVPYPELEAHLSDLVSDFTQSLFKTNLKVCVSSAVDEEILISVAPKNIDSN